MRMGGASATDLKTTGSGRSEGEMEKRVEAWYLYDTSDVVKVLRDLNAHDIL